MSEVEIEEGAERTRVGFPEAQTEEPRNLNYKALIIVLLILLLIGGGVWYMFFRQGAQEDAIVEESPTPSSEVTMTVTPTIEAVDKEDIKIQVLNGSGIAGAAGKAQSALTAAGYSGIEVGNADSYTYKTTVAAFGDTVPAAVKEEITEELEKIYGTIDTKPNTSTQYDVVITIGLPKGFSPSPAGKPASTSVTPTKSSSTGTITPTKSSNLTTTLTPTP